MRLMVIAVGRLKDGPERELAQRYRKRLENLGRGLGLSPLDVIEVPESRASDAASRIKAEAAAIATLIPDRATLVALDAGGRNLDSTSLAHQLGRWRDDAVPAITFLIGGPDGLSPDSRSKARMTLAFGAATWPHQIVRVMLFEQLYRAATILSGHPYHRA